MHVSTHFTSHGLVATAAHLDQGAGSCVECGETRALKVFMSFMARSAIFIHRSNFSFNGDFPKKLAINFVQRARHIANLDVALLLSVRDDKEQGAYERGWRRVKDGGC